MNPFRREMDYFLTLCQTLNISEAAEKTGIQQAGLSKSLKTLESEFGNPLFYRTNRGLKITPFGQLLERNLQKTKETWNDSFRGGKVRLEDIVGTYTIGAHPTVAVNSVSHFFPQLCEAHPGLELRLDLKRSREVAKDVIDFSTDIGIVANPEEHPDLVIVPLYREFIGVWGQRHLESSEKILYYNPEMIHVVSTLKKYKKYKKIEVNDYDVIASILDQSNSLGILPSPAAESNPSLKLIGRKISDVKICMIYRHDIFKSLAFKEIVSFIKEKSTLKP